MLNLLALLGGGHTAASGAAIVLIEVVVFDGVLHVFNDGLLGVLAGYAVAAFMLQCYLHCGVIIFLILLQEEDVNGPIIVDDQKLVNIFLFRTGLEPLDDFDLSLLHARRLRLVVLGYFTVAHQVRIKRVDVTARASHNALQLRLVAFVAELHRFGHEGRHVVSSRIHCYF